MEVINKFYIQRFFAKRLKSSDVYKAVTYTQFEGDKKHIPFYYKRLHGHTGTIDLTKDMNILVSEFKTKTRNEIRRAEKEGCTWEYNYDYDSFIPYYNEFSSSRGLNENIDRSRLDKYDRTVISLVKHGNDILTMHATVVNKEESFAMLLYSGSIRLEKGVDRNLIGWGNRFLHYKEFELFKSWGIERYEWDGICIDPNDKAKFGIGKFKQEFGGVVKESFSLRTPLFLIMKKVQTLLSKLH